MIPLCNGEAYVDPSRIAGAKMDRRENGRSTIILHLSHTVPLHLNYSNREDREADWRAIECALGLRDARLEQ